MFLLPCCGLAELTTATCIAKYFSYFYANLSFCLASSCRKKTADTSSHRWKLQTPPVTAPAGEDAEKSPVPSLPPAERILQLTVCHYITLLTGYGKPHGGDDFLYFNIPCCELSLLYDFRETLLIFP